MPTWTEPQYVVEGEASSDQFNAEVVDNLKYLKAQTAEDLPRGVIGYAEQTSDQLIANSSAEFDSFACSFNVAENRKVRVEWFGRIQSSDAGDTITVRMRDDDTSEEVMACTASINNDGGFVPGAMARILAGEFTGLAEGTHTFRIHVTRPFGTGTGGFRGSSSVPAVIIISDEGPSV